MSILRCPNPRCQASYPSGTVQCTKAFCQCLLPGAVVAARYRIETLIGMGGMGAVYRASDTFEVEQVALKVLSFANGVKNMETAVERFRREARYAHQLKHKNIVPVLNFGQDGKLLYLVMPIVTGGTLKALLKAERPLPIPQAQGYLNDLADAVDAIHNHPQQIIHRDIKPSNLLIHQDDGRLVVTDFGIARAMQREKALTQRGWTLGTEHYIAPEQEHGKAEPASDIYAMGVIAYQMFTGLLPFQAVVRNRAADLPMPSELNPTLPLVIDPIIMRAIEIDPTKRFRTGREFADALNAALALEKDTDTAILMTPTTSTEAGRGPVEVGQTDAEANLGSAKAIVRTIILENPCASCGRENRSTSHFCRHCGHSLDETFPLATDACQVGYVGAISTGQNEDRLLIVQGLCNTLQPPPRPFSLFAIADGQGFAGAGREPAPSPQGNTTRDHEAVEARWEQTPPLQAPLAIETITDVLLPLLSTAASVQSHTSAPTEVGKTTTHLQITKQTDEERIEQWLHNAVRQANQVIYHCNADYDTTMTSSLISIILYNRHLYLAKVGDSRAYCYNEKTGLQQINTHLSQTSVGANQDQDSIKPYLGEQYQVAIELFKRDVEADDLILLCTNGIWHTLNDEQIQNILALGGDIQRLAHTLVDTAGSTENSSVIAVRVQ